MSAVNYYDAGFEELEKMLSDFSDNIDQALSAVEQAANEFVSDVKKMPRPRSAMNSAGYTHLLDTISSRNTGKEIEVGWGKYYGPMVERGTRKMAGTPHLVPTFDRNKEKYYKKITDEMFGGNG